MSYFESLKDEWDHIDSSKARGLSDAAIESQLAGWIAAIDGNFLLADEEKAKRRATAEAWARGQREVRVTLARIAHENIDKQAEITKGCIRKRVTDPDFLAENLAIVDEDAAREHAAVDA